MHGMYANQHGRSMAVAIVRAHLATSLQEVATESTEHETEPYCSLHPGLQLISRRRGIRPSKLLTQTTFSESGESASSPTALELCTEPLHSTFVELGDVVEALRHCCRVQGAASHALKLPSPSKRKSSEAGRGRTCLHH